MDNLSLAERSTQMRLIKAKDIKPELIVRHITHRLGYRYRLHRRNLPGSPDLVFPAQRKVIFVLDVFGIAIALKNAVSLVGQNLNWIIGSQNWKLIKFGIKRTNDNY